MKMKTKPETPRREIVVEIRGKPMSCLKIDPQTEGQELNLNSLEESRLLLHFFDVNRVTVEKQSSQETVGFFWRDLLSVGPLPVREDDVWDKRKPEDVLSLSSLATMSRK